MRRILDALQQRPQPVPVAFAVRVQEHQRVAIRVPRACQSRSCQAHAMLRYVRFSWVPNSCKNGNVVQQYYNTSARTYYVAIDCIVKDGVAFVRKLLLKEEVRQVVFHL